MGSKSAANCIQISVSPHFSISVAVSIIKVSQVQHVDHNPRERANGPKLLIQLYACRCGLNPVGIKREKEPQAPLLVLAGYG